MKKLLLHLGALALLIVLLPLPAVLQPSGPREEASSAPDTASYAASAPFLQQELPAYYRVLETGSGRILKVSPKEYLKGTAAAELPAGWHRETVIAQMVASHSYALTVMAQMLPETPQISDDPTRHQGYLTEEERRTLYGSGFDEQEAFLDSAAEEALSWLLTSDGEEILPAVFHACSSGRTESAGNVWGGSIACLSAVESPADRNAPEYRREHTFSLQEASDVLAEHLDGFVPSDEPITVIRTSPSGTVLEADAGGVSCTGTQLRSWFSLPSACFTVGCSPGAITFITFGSGHGVGMSQYGAEQMALSGSSWRDILAHYYPGSVLLKISLQDVGI